MMRVLALSLVVACSNGSEPSGPTHETLDIAQRLADEGLERWPSDLLAAGWIETVWHFGLVRLHDAAPSEHLEQAWREWLGGVDVGYFESSDSISPSSIASLALAREPDTHLENVVGSALHYIDVDAARTSEGAITHWGEGALFPADEVWIDSQFMFGMLLLHEYDRTGDRTRLDQFVDQYRVFSELCRDPNDQLYRHAYKDSTGENIPTEDTYWARGNSWVLISGAELLHRVPPTDPAAREVRPLFESHARAVIDLQADDGLWHTVLNSPRGEDPSNYTETSAAALIGYALVRGLEAGVEQEGTVEAIGAAVDGVRGRLSEDGGALSLAGTSFGTNPGDYEYYVGIDRLDDLLLGHGSVVAFLAQVDGVQVRE